MLTTLANPAVLVNEPPLEIDFGVAGHGVAQGRRIGPVRRKVERLLLGGMQSGNKDVCGTCRELYEHRDWLWTFLHHEGVAPTNNAGDRSLRHAVIWR
jgi:hypothetical protein